MSFTAEQKEAIEILVGLCMSCKEASPLSKLLREYSEMENKQLNISGFNSITEFLNASGRFHLVNRGGIIFAAAKLTMESAHIAMLVNKQRSTKRRNAAGFILRDGLFDNTISKQRKQTRHGSVGRFQAPRSLSVNTQSYSYSKSYQTKPVKPKTALSNFKITKTFSNAGFPKKDLQPLPSQLAKVVTPENQKVATNQASKSQFEFSSQKPLPSQLAKVVTPPIKSQFELTSQKPLPSQLAKVVSPAIQKLSNNSPSKPEIQFPSQKSVIDVVQKSLQNLNVDTTPKNEHPIICASKPVERVTNQLSTQQIVPSTANVSNFSLDTKIDLKDDLNNNRMSTPLSSNHDLSSTIQKVRPQFEQLNLEPSSEEHANNYFLKVNQNKKQSVQERLNQIKYSTPKNQPQPKVAEKPEVTEEKEKQIEEKEKTVIPIGWWTSGNYSIMERLEEYCHVLGLASPEYKIFTSSKVGKRKYQCRCFVDGVTYNTYPDDFDTEDQARDACAAIAVSTIRQQEELAQYPLFQGTSQEIASKIYDIVNEHKAGVFLIQIPNIFRSKHNVSLPSDFVDVITNNPDKFVIDDSLMISNSVIVYINEIEQDKVSNKCKNLPELEIPWNESDWKVAVTFPETPTSVWVILLGPKYYDEYKKLMYRIYEMKLKSPIKIELGDFYIAEIHNYRHRVKVVEKNDDKYLSHFIDSGEYEMLSEDNLFECNSQFLELPAQAFQITLKGLSLFDQLPGIDFCLSDLCDKSMIAVVHSSESEYKLHKIVEVTLYDTSTDLDINVNDKLIDKIGETALKPAKLSGKLTSVIITGLQDSGILTAYLKHDSYHYMIQNEIKRLIVDEDLLQECTTTLDNLNSADNEIYLVWNRMSNEYLRGVIVDMNSNGGIVVSLIDYGTEIIVNRNAKFYRITSLSKALSIIPPQAIRMRYHNIQIDNPTAMSLVRGYFRPDVDSYAKIIEVTDLPSVEIYIKKRGKIICISEEINEQMSFKPVQ